MFGNFVKNMRSRNNTTGYSEVTNNNNDLNTIVNTNNNALYEDPSTLHLNNYNFNGFSDKTQDHNIPSNVLSQNVIQKSSLSNNNTSNIINNEGPNVDSSNPADAVPKKGRGRPRSATKKEKPVTPGRGRGRPKGSIKPDAACRLQKPPVPGRSRGRPKGSKKKVGSNVSKPETGTKVTKKVQKILPTKVVANFPNEEVHDMNTPYIY